MCQLSHSTSPSIEVKKEKKPINGERVQKYSFSGDITHIFCFLSLKEIFLICIIYLWDLLLKSAPTICFQVKFFFKKDTVFINN